MGSILHLPRQPLVTGNVYFLQSHGPNRTLVYIPALNSEMALPIYVPVEEIATQLGFAFAVNAQGLGFAFDPDYIQHVQPWFHTADTAQPAGFKIRLPAWAVSSIFSHRVIPLHDFGDYPSGVLAKFASDYIVSFPVPMAAFDAMRSGLANCTIG